MSERRGGMDGVPRVPRFAVARPRLFAMLDGTQQVTLVSGMLGVGKSLLVADWLRQRSTPAPVLWLPGSAAQSRIAFWRAVVDSASDAGLMRATETASDVRPAGDTTPLLDAVLSAVNAALPRDVVLVLDGIDRPGDQGLVDDALLLLREHPARRLVVTTRSVLEVATAATTVLIGPKDLLFTAEEVATALAVDAAAAHDIHSATGGVPVLVRLAGLVQDEGGELGASSLLETLPPRFVQLLSASVGALDGVLAFPEPLRGALVAEIGVRFPDESARLLPDAVDASERGGDWVTALSLAVAAGDLSRAEAIARAAWPRASVADAALVIVALGTVSLRRLRRYPLLSLLLGLSYTATPGRRPRAAELFGLVIAAGRSRSGASIEERALSLTAESVAFRMVGEATLAARSADAAVDALRSGGLGAAARALVLMQAGRSVFSSGDTGRARGLLEQAASLRAGGSPALVLPTDMLGGLDALNGDLGGARLMLAESAEREEFHGWSGDSSTFRHLALALLALERFDIEEAQRACDAMAARDWASEHWAWCMHVQSTIDLVRDGPAVASTLLAGRVATGNHAALNPATRGVLDRTRALLALADGRPGEAELALRNLTSEPALTAVARARIELFTGQADAAVRLLGAIDHGRNIRSSAEALLLEAAAHHQLGSMAFATGSFASAVEMLLESGLRMPLALTPRAPLLALAEQAELAGDRRVAELEIARVPLLLPERASRITLTDRERVVLAALAETGNTQQIAAALFVSPNTVKSQLRSIYRKLDVSSRDAALSRASQFGLLSR